MADPPVFEIDPGEESQFQVVVNPNKRARKDSPLDRSQSTSQYRSKIQPIIVTGIKPDLSKNSINLAKLLTKEKPNATIKETKWTKNNNLLIFPSDPHSANILLKPWKQNSLLGNPKPKLPQQSPNQLFSVVVCGVNPEITDEQIMSELQDLGYKPKVAKRLISKITKSPTWKIKVSFEDEMDSVDLLKDGLVLGYQKHRIEKYNELPNVMQCFKCQGFGHTYYKCPNVQKCLRCGDDHNIKNCPKEREQKKCANCGGNHISMYKGCPEFIKARQELKQQNTTKSYAEATKVEVTSKISKPEKINITLFCAELIRACLAKAGFKISTSDTMSYAANLALAHLNLMTTGEELFNALKNPQFPEHKQAIDLIRRKSSEDPNK
ncbi:hypothetical protein HOLleu_02961 [Holothuria leucospilota]|uniref:CCHC-type domain-containing protein n=1 Tax=Holothuria leucospilota TaxID=206669 RepID=A0A9Q1CSA8_HOLLE|nr:hypothetical protein HOLleu_02961 [Holothuria leucospilota]